MKRPRKVRAFNRVQPQMTEEDQRRQQFISPSKHKLNPYLMMHFARTEQFTAGSPVEPWTPNIIYPVGLGSSEAFGSISFVTDIYASDVSLLLAMDGSNNSTTFTDYSISPKTMTANGNAKISTTQYKWASYGSSGYFDGNGDYLTTPDNAAFNFGAGNFTLEAWIYISSYVSGSAILHKGNTAYGPFLIYIGGSNEISFYSSGNGTSWSIVSDLRFATNPSTSTWHHIAITRSGSTFRTFFNGTLANSTTSSATVVTNAGDLNVGRYTNTTTTFNGYMSDLRITKGIARYTASFTAPTAPFK